MTKRKTQESVDIIISGAGIPGLTLALLLGRLGLRVAMVDPAAPPTLESALKKIDGRTSALMEGSLNILRACGIWDDLKEYGEELRILRIVDDSAGGAQKPVSVDFSAGDIGLKAFGTNFPNAVMQAVLADAAFKNKNIRIITGAGVKNFATDAHLIHVTLDNGDELSARLLTGADGRASPVREHAGIAVHKHDYGQSAITCAISHTRPHAFTSTEFHRSGGPFTIVPLPGSRSSIVWVEKTEDARRFMAIGKQAFERALQDRTRGAVGEIKLESTPACWPLVGQQAARITAPRVALIAEAAHVLHPLGAQGLNLSLRDAAALAEVIADAARLGLDIGSAATLDEYEKKRRSDLLSRAIGTQGLNDMVSNDISLLRGLRHAGLKTLGRVRPLKVMAMKKGLAPQSEDSRLTRGEAL